jgi:hypothetical protein
MSDRGRIVELKIISQYPDKTFAIENIDPSAFDALLLGDHSISQHTNGDLSSWNTGSWQANPTLLFVKKGDYKGFDKNATPKPAEIEERGKVIEIIPTIQYPNGEI